MRLASVAEAKTIDSRTQKEFGISGEDLMATAGRLSAEYIIENFKKHIRPPAKVVAICGPGNNGKDGLIAAQALRESGIEVEILLLEDLETNLKDSTPKDNEQSGHHAKHPLRKAALIIDAVFGIGLNREVTGAAKELIRAINESKAIKVSLDTPSGLNAETGNVDGAAVIADITLTFGIAKRGFAVNDGPSRIGKLEVLDIGFPLELVKEVASTTLGFDRALARKFLPRRHSSGNKSTFGRVQVFAGSKGMGGAAMLAANSASRIGAGYVVVATNGDPKEILAESPEFMTADIRDPAVFENAKWSSCIVGPGFGEAAREVLEKLREASSAPAVIDADALTALASMASESAKLRMMSPGNWILTPHAGELSRLLSAGVIEKIDAKTIEADRFRYASEAARKFNCIVLLKGFRTVVSDGRKSVVVLSGNAALAKAGMGDVLSGVIGGLLAQGLKPFTAACLGAYVHGFLADEWIRAGKDVLSFQPSDLSSSLPFVLKKLRTKSEFQAHEVQRRK